MKVNAIKCPVCKDIIYSRSQHDFHWCTCGNTAIDGGNEYVRISAKSHFDDIVVRQIEINATKSQLYYDWCYNKNKFGTIKGGVDAI